MCLCVWTFCKYMFSQIVWSQSDSIYEITIISSIYILPCLFLRQTTATILMLKPEIEGRPLLIVFVLQNMSIDGQKGIDEMIRIPWLDNYLCLKQNNQSEHNIYYAIVCCATRCPQHVSQSDQNLQLASRCLLTLPVQTTMTWYSSRVSHWICLVRWNWQYACLSLSVYLCLSPPPPPPSAKNTHFLIEKNPWIHYTGEQSKLFF